MYGVNYIFYAAALKEVPSCEFFPMEAVRTNIIGTDNVITAAVENHVERVVFLSTDKAAYPINAMGMTKAVGEKVYETLMTREERLRSVDMGHYFRIAPVARGLNYDKFYVQGTVNTEGDEAYTSHNTNRLDVNGVVKKIMTTDYVREELEGRPHAVDA